MSNVNLSVEEIGNILSDYASIGDLQGIIKTFKLLYNYNEPLFLRNYIENGKDELWQQTFSTCAKNGNVDVVDYLLNNEKVKPKEDRDIHIINGLTSACSTGNAEMAQYFLNNPECPEIAKFSTEKPFKMACVKNKINIINLFLYDLNIPIEKNFEEQLKVMISLTYQAAAIVNGNSYFKTLNEEK